MARTMLSSSGHQRVNGPITGLKEFTDKDKKSEKPSFTVFFLKTGIRFEFQLWTVLDPGHVIQPLWASC